MTVQIEQYIEVLQLLADPPGQLEYERNVPIANVPAELVCMWFDDLPPPSAIEGVSTEQREILEAFSRFYDERVSALPDSGGVRALHAMLVWNEVVESAQKALHGLHEASNPRLHTDQATPGS